MPHDAPRVHFVALTCAVISVTAFAWLLTFGTFRFFTEDSFGSFYDHQAAAWLEGRWDVPEAALSGEAFIVDGKVYGYFGPTPALKRLPLALLGIGFAQGTRVFMLLDYIACLAAAYALLRLAARWRDGQSAPSNFATALFMLSVGLGSTLYFLGSRAYVYHEAILCGAAFGLWSVYCALQYVRAPAARWWLGAWACGLAAVHARPPAGLLAFSVLGCAAAFTGWTTARRASRASLATIRTPLAIIALSAAGIFSFSVVSYIKFRTFEGCPLRYNVQYPPEKMAVLEHRNFHLSNLRFNADCYLFRASFTLRPEFPYLYREYLDRTKYPESRMAYRDPTVAMPWSMPALFALATAGSLLAAYRWQDVRRPIGALWLGAVPSAGAMLTAVAVTQRYTADFAPFLISAAAFGIVALTDLPRTGRSAAVAIVTALAAWGIAITFAFSLHNQREIVWGVSEEVRHEYQQFRQRVDDVFGRPHRR